MAGEPTFSFDKRMINVKSGGQTRYVEAMRRNDIVFGIGPAGTGKTYLAVAMAVRLLKDEARRAHRPGAPRGRGGGEPRLSARATCRRRSIPYLRPLYDALQEMIHFEKLQRFLQIGVIEVAPLAYMRGRTLSRAFVILDEAQNTTLSADEDVPDPPRARTRAR